MILVRRFQLPTFLAVIGLGLPLAGCASLLEEVEQIPAPDVVKAISSIKTVAANIIWRGNCRLLGP